MPWDPNDAMFANDISLSIATSSSIILPSFFNRDAPICPTSNDFQERRTRSSCNVIHFAPAKSGLTRNLKACKAVSPRKRGTKVLPRNIREVQTDTTGRYVPQDKDLGRLRLIGSPKYCQLFRYLINLFSLQLVEIVTRLNLVLSTVPSRISNSRQHNKSSFSFHYREPNTPGTNILASRLLNSEARRDLLYAPFNKSILKRPSLSISHARSTELNHTDTNPLMLNTTFLRPHH
ncbi:hypothetical protein I312_105139 [Cryptococcus bacillisporus CA1280]|uniref:uncharacterized protein n=1 Tax=Cryptococcus bacillisporus CA1280 TaxID=1296109 RepID=UPI0033681AF5